MAKATYKINTSDFKKLTSACRITQVKVMDGPQEIPGNKLIVELDYRQPADLIDMGLNLAIVTGTEFDAADKKKAEEEKARLAKAK